MRPIHTNSILSAAAIAVLSLGAAAFADEQRPSIQVTGEGTATARPDRATIQAGVVTQAATASEALDANSRAMDRMLAVLREHGLEGRDLQTVQFNIHPVYERERPGVRGPEVVGYRVTNQVGVRVRELRRLGEVLDAVVRAGANVMSGIRFEVSDRDEVLDHARRRAMADARRRATVYAQEAGVRLGPVVAIQEQAVSIPFPRMQAARTLAVDAAHVPIEEGEEEVRAQVSVTFRILEDGERPDLAAEEARPIR